MKNEKMIARYHGRPNVELTEKRLVASKEEGGLIQTLNVANNVAHIQK